MYFVQHLFFLTLDTITIAILFLVYSNLYAINYLKHELSIDIKKIKKNRNIRIYIYVYIYIYIYTRVSQPDSSLFSLIYILYPNLFANKYNVNYSDYNWYYK